MTNQVLIEEPKVLYDLQSGDYSQSGKFLSSHLLGMFRKCPFLYHKAVTGWQRPSKDHFVIGSALHSLVLEGKNKYATNYAYNEPLNPATGKPFGPATKKHQQWQDELQAEGKTGLTRSQASLVTRMAESIACHKEATRLLLKAPHRETVSRTVYHDVPCQVRVDACGEVGIVDLKTCDNLDRFVYSAKSYGYTEQLAFYRAILRIVKEEFTTQTHIVAVEKTFLYRCGVWKVDESELEWQEHANEQAIVELKQCTQNNVWPTHYEVVRVLGE